MKKMNKDCHLPRKCVIHSSTNGRMNESLTAEWVHYVVGCISFAPRFLVWDTYNGHTTIKVKEALWQASINTALAPGDCTKRIQAHDM